jgi:hypothetical protein
MTALRQNARRIRNVLNSFEYRLVLSKIHHGYRPSQIADQIHISRQSLNYYMNNLIKLNLIEKLGDRSGISWRLTDRGEFILKEFIRWSVNSHNNQNYPNILFYDAKIPVRLHNVSFAFKINSSLEHLSIKWKNMRNGVSRHTVIKKNSNEQNTVDLVKTSNFMNSIMLIHMKEVYTFNTYKEIIRLYEAARITAVRTAHEFGIQISASGELVKKPHLAFEGDLTALYLAAFETASAKAADNKGKAWIDASHGLGELETNCPDYAFKYLVMPESVFETHLDVKMIKEMLFGYRMHYDPVLTRNN